MRKHLLLLALCGSLTVPLSATAAEEKENKPEKEDAKEKQQKPADKDKKADQDKKKEDIFKPTEEISEDYSVPFPTDI